MEQTLRTRSLRTPRDEQSRRRITANTGAGDVVQADVARTIIDITGPRHRHRAPSPSVRHLRIDQPKVVPIYGRNHGQAPGLAEPASPWVLRGWLVQSLLLEAIMHDASGDVGATEHALERALGLAERDRVLLPFLVHPVPALLERNAGRCMAHADLISEIFDLLAAHTEHSRLRTDQSLREPLTESEVRVLRLLPTNLSKREIAGELYLSVNTIKAHTRRLYAKLDAHSRGEAVERARELGLLSGSLRTR